LSAINHASEINIAAAFITAQGLSLLFDSLTDALRRKVKINLLTGDYLYFTSPEALRLLLVLKAQGADVRIFESGQKQSFHMKAYLFVRAFNNGRDQGCAFVGSSNITKMALRYGLEWNLCVDRQEDEDRFTQILGQFDNLFKDPRCKTLSNSWIDCYQKRTPERAKVIPGLLEVDEPTEVPTPNPIQAEALLALTQTRVEGYRRGLVVLATGLGKTWLAAFDSAVVNASEYCLWRIAKKHQNAPIRLIFSTCAMTTKFTARTCLKALNLNNFVHLATLVFTTKLSTIKRSNGETANSTQTNCSTNWPP
jgi:HKD family nuclease